VLEKAGVDAKAAYAMVSIFPLRSDILKLTQISEKAAEEAQKAAEAALKRDEKAAEAAQKRDEKAAEAAQTQLYTMILLAIAGGIVVILNASGETLMTKIIRYSISFLTLLPCIPCAVCPSCSHSWLL
jgi:hypothetical protein